MSRLRELQEALARAVSRERELRKEAVEAMKKGLNRRQPSDEFHLGRGEIRRLLRELAELRAESDDSAT